jgi:hypothetical protein
LRDFACRFRLTAGPDPATAAPSRELVLLPAGKCCDGGLDTGRRALRATLMRGPRRFVDGIHFVLVCNRRKNSVDESIARNLNFKYRRAALRLTQIKEVLARWPRVNGSGSGRIDGLARAPRRCVFFTKKTAMNSTTRSCCLAARRAAGRRIGNAVALACALGASVAPLATVAQTRYHSDCRVIGEMNLEHFGREGQPAELSHFTCRISGGPLDGFVVNGTNIWELRGGQGSLIGSMAIAQKASSILVYEIQDVVRKQQTDQGRVIGRQGASHGIFKAGTGSAVSLVGKTFSSVARRTAPGRFSIDSVVDIGSAIAKPARND